MKPVTLPLTMHRVLRLALRLGGSMRGAWRLRRLVTDVERLKFPPGLIRTRLTSGQWLWIDPNDSMARHIFYFGLWEPAVATHFLASLRAGDNVLDVGASIGQYTVLAGSVTGGTGRRFAVEPGPTGSILRKNIELNGEEGATVLDVAAWSTNAELHLSPGDSGTNGLAFVSESAGNGQFRAVRGRRLDEELESRGCNRIDIIKLDVEGAELPALKGLSSLFAKSTPRAIYCEVEGEHTAKYGYTPADLVAYLKAYGFKAQIFLNRNRGLAAYDPQRQNDPEYTNMVLFTEAGSVAARDQVSPA